MPSDYLLKMDEVKGESAQEGFKENIEIESFSWGASQSGAFHSGGGGGAGRVSFSDISFTTYAGSQSPVLALFCSNGHHVPKSVLTLRKAGGKQETFYTVTLYDSLVSSFMSGGSNSGTGVLPIDQFSLNFAKVEFIYKPQQAKGSTSGDVVFKYNIKEGKDG